jgi:hypothetical protein
MLIWASKDPDEIVKRNFDWSTHASWREGDKISSSSFSLSTAAGMAIDSSTDDSPHGRQQPEPRLPTERNALVDNRSSLDG